MLQLCLVAMSCPTHCDLMDWSLPGSSVCGVLQAGILKWVTISSPRGSSWSRDRTCVPCVSCIAGRFFTCWAIREAHWCFGKKQYEAKYKADLRESSMKQWVIRKLWKYRSMELRIQYGNDIWEKWINIKGISGLCVMRKKKLRNVFILVLSRTGKHIHRLN